MRTAISPRFAIRTFLNIAFQTTTRRARRSLLFAALILPVEYTIRMPEITEQCDAVPAWLSEPKKLHKYKKPHAWSVRP